MRTWTWWWRVAAILVLAALAHTEAWAGKGKPGGGGGSVTPRYEIVFAGITKTNVTVVGGFDLYGVNLDGTGLVQVTEGGRHNGRRLNWDPRGDVAFLNSLGSGVPIVPETGEGLATVVHYPVGITRKVDGQGDLRPYDEQAGLVNYSLAIGTNPYNGRTIGTECLALQTLDGSGTLEPVIVGTWTDLGNQVVRFDSPANEVFVPDPQDPERAWLFYQVQTWTFDASTEQATASTYQWYRQLIDYAGWPAVPLDLVGAPVAISESPLRWYHRPVTLDGGWVLANEGGQAYAYPVDWSSGAPVIRAPTSADRLGVVPPSGWEPDVEVLDVSPDGEKVIVRLFRYEGRKTKVLLDHLFVANRDGTGLVQLDVDTATVQFQRLGPLTFDSSAAFRPARP